jgi:hypothetical protein
MIACAERMPSPSARRGSGPYRWSTNREPDRAGSPRRPRLLLICDYRPREAATVLDHIHAIREWSASDVFVLPTYGDIPDELDLAGFDALVIHYNVVMSVDLYLSPLARWRISQFRGTTGAFIQDEYRFVDRTVSVMRTLGVNVLFTCVPEDQIPLIYPREALPDLRRTVTVLTGYVPPELLNIPIAPYDARPVDVAYRARRLPPWLGRLAMEKATIADRFLADAPTHGLHVDISVNEEDRIYGPAWIEFLSRSKALLGVETGASVTDFDGSIEARTRTYMGRHPDATFEEIHRAVLEDVDGLIRWNQISPRCFEAAALGTMMVLYPGAYSGALEAWRHYVPLEKTHANMDEVVAAIRDQATWERITSQARSEVAENPRFAYRALAEAMDRGLDLRAVSQTGISAADFDRIADRAFRRLPTTQAHALGLPPRVNRFRRIPGRIAVLTKPSPTAILAVPQGTDPRQRLWRRRIRVGRAAAYWIAHPRMLPASVMRAYGRTLLEELSQLALLQAHGARAVGTGAGSPFVLRADETSGTLSIEHQAAGAGSTEPGIIPEDLGWVRTLKLDLANRWLIPGGIGPARDHRFEALSALFRDRPDVGRRLLVGRAPWCAIGATGSLPPAGAGGG